MFVCLSCIAKQAKYSQPAHANSLNVVYLVKGAICGVTENVRGQWPMEKDLHKKYNNFLINTPSGLEDSSNGLLY